MWFIWRGFFVWTFIYDNAANRLGKGITHTLSRVNCHMQRHFRKYGLNGYIVTCNFSDFFNSASHKVVYNENKKRIFDENIRNIANKCMEIYGEKSDKKAIIRLTKVIKNCIMNILKEVILQNIMKRKSLAYK